MKQLCRYVTTVMIFVTASAQTSSIGGKEYGLASSSVMWIPRGSALFLNPSELGRIHQNEFLFNTNRFRSLASMIGTYSFPSAGTFAIGIANQDSLTNYTVGYGRLIGRYHTIGTSLSIISPIQDGLRFSFGGTVHFPTSEQNSGFHAGINIANLPKETMMTGGIAWWAVPDWLRFQAAIQNRTAAAMVYGIEMLAAENFSFIMGSRTFKNMYGGVSYSASTFTADLTAGPKGITFSLNIIAGETAEDQRSMAYEDGYDLFSEKRYYEAHLKFLNALEYDEYDDDSRTMAAISETVMDSVETANVAQGRIFEEKLDFPSAIQAFQVVMRANPTNTIADTLLSSARKKLALYIDKLILIGDSLKDRKEITRARANYGLALKYDPGNEIASARIDELENLSKENVKSILAHARTLLNKKQLDNAQKEYERVLDIEPTNSRAKAGLNIIITKRKEEQFDIAKTALDDGRYFEALTMMLTLATQNGTNNELSTYIEKARAKLQPEVEKEFKRGLTLYIKENYYDAIAVWDSALVIQPRHTGILEYRNRAEEKMKALEQLK